MKTTYEPCPPLPGHLEEVAKILASYGFHPAAACVRSADKALNSSFPPLPTAGAGKDEDDRTLIERLEAMQRTMRKPLPGMDWPAGANTLQEAIDELKAAQNG